MSTMTSMSQPSQTVWWTSIIPCLWNHARIRLHQGKTVVWNKAGICLRGCHALEDAARRADPNAVVWRGNVLLEPELQGLGVLGVPVGRPEFIWPSWRPNLANTMFSSTGSHLWVTFSQLGVCSFIVLQPGSIFGCGQCHRSSQVSSPANMMLVCGVACVNFSISTLPQSMTQLKRQLLFRWQLEDSVCVPLSVSVTQPTGQVGPTC